MKFLKIHRYKIILALIVLIGLYVRFYNFPAWQGFDYDQEINANIAREILIDRKIVLIGPETSVGGMFVGSFFNYFIAVFFWLGKMNPVATILANIMISAATLGAFFIVGKKLFSEKIGLLASLIYCFSSFLISYDRVLWNPTPIPLVSLGIFFFVFQFLKKNKLQDLIFGSLLVGLMFHLHFQAFFLLAFLIFALFLGGKKTITLRNFLTIGISLTPFIFPLFVFDLRHQFLNSGHLLSFLTSSHQGAKLPIMDLVLRAISIFIELNGAILTSSKDLGITIFTILVTIVLLFFSFVKRDLKNQRFYHLCLLLFVLGIVGLSLYSGTIPIQYLFFVFPIFVLLLAVFVEKMFHLGIVGKIAVSFVFVFYLYLNLPLIFNSRSDLSLLNKISAVNYISSQAGARTYSVDFVTAPGLNTGFHYLLWLDQYSVKRVNSGQVLKYKIVVPKSIARPSEIVASFGAVGIAKNE